VTQRSTAPAPEAALPPKIRGALVRYRVLAYVTGVWLLLLTAVVVAKYGFGASPPGFVAVVHGWVYAVYLALTLDLAVKARWRPLPAVGVLIAGTVPFLSFVVERAVTAKVRRGERL
jgi:integral membrane protein